MDKVVGDVFKMMTADDGMMVKEDEFKKLLTEILGRIMLQLEGNPISVPTISTMHLIFLRTIFSHLNREALEELLEALNSYGIRKLA